MTRLLPPPPPPPSGASFLQRERSPGHSGAAPGLARGGRRTDRGLRTRRGGGCCSFNPQMLLPFVIAALGRTGWGVCGWVGGWGVRPPLEIQSEAITCVHVKEWCKAVRGIWRLGLSFFVARPETG